MAVALQPEAEVEPTGIGVGSRIKDRRLSCCYLVNFLRFPSSSTTTAAAILYIF